MTENKITNKTLRARRTRSRINKGRSILPRLSVFKSNKYIYLQLIDDSKGATIVSARDAEIKEKAGSRREKAHQLGKMLADRAKEKKISKIVFDRGRYSYHGIVRAVAEGAREGGLEF